MKTSGYRLHLRKLNALYCPAGGPLGWNEAGHIAKAGFAKPRFAKPGPSRLLILD
jgi:hypothetical protein